jgi:hypothetical protein
MSAFPGQASNWPAAGVSLPTCVAGRGTPAAWLCKAKEFRKDPEVSEEKVRSEEFRVQGEEIMAKVKELLHEGNIRRISIRNEEGKVLIDLPLSVGVVGALVKPQIVARGAIAALVTRGSIVVEKVEE